MASGCCGKQTCSCIINAGYGIEVTGTGSATDPYVIESDIGALSDILRVVDSNSINFSVSGTGTVEDPLTITGISTLRLTDLADVADPSGLPTAGESPVWVITSGVGHWEFQVPPANPSGSVNVGAGLSGTGAIGNPILVEVSGVWGSGALAGLGGDSTIGLPIYVDSAGDLRAKPVSNPAWADITGKPATFAPAPHTHTAAQITDLSTNGNAKRTNGILISSTATSTTPPASPTVGDLWFFPEGA